MKKNKKLFAILTLVAFMMTLMPVMAFAAQPVQADLLTPTATPITFNDDGTLTLNVTGAATGVYKITAKANIDNSTTPTTDGATKTNVAAVAGFYAVVSTDAPAATTSEVPLDTTAQAKVIEVTASDEEVAAAVKAWADYKTETVAADVDDAIDTFTDAYEALNASEQDTFHAVANVTAEVAKTTAAVKYAVAAFAAYDAAETNETLFTAFKRAYALTTDALFAAYVNDAAKATVAKNVAGAADIYAAIDILNGGTALATAVDAWDALYAAPTAALWSDGTDGFKDVYPKVPAADFAAAVGSQAALAVNVYNAATFGEALKLINADKTGGGSGSGSGVVDSGTSVYGAKYVNGGNMNINQNVATNVLWLDGGRNDVNAAQKDIVIWAEDVNNVGTPSSALALVNGAANPNATVPVGDALLTLYPYVYTVNNVSNLTNINLQFSRAGEYKIYAAILSDVGSGTTASAAISNSKDAKLSEGNSKVVINDLATDPRQTYTATVSGSFWSTTQTLKDGQVSDAISVKANNVAYQNVTVTMKNDDNRLVGKTVTIETNSANLTASKTSAVTNSWGQIDFDLSGSREGTYYVFLNCDGFEVQLKVVVGNTAAAYITLTEQPDAPVALYGGTEDVDIRVALTDINGNVVTGTNPEGATNAFNNTTKYVAFDSKPTGTNLKNSDLVLAYDAASQEYYVKLNQTFDREGNYVIRIVLDNGNFVTVPFEVKTFTTPVQVLLDYDQTSIELAGTSNVPSVKYVDANGTKQDAKNKVTLAGTGYAISNFASNGQITIKNDEKYIGQTITVTAVDSRYNLTATANLTVADEAQSIKFDSTKAQVNINNKIDFKVVDSLGNVVSLGNNADVKEVKFVITSKPENAKVSAVISGNYVNDLKSEGKATMALTSDKEGDVTVQVLVSVETTSSTSSTGLATKYYTGTETFKVSKQIGNGSAVVMTIGSATMVVNDTTVAIDAAAMIQDNRTFVPVRALMEAFGATVDFDAATNKITIVADGKNIELTLGSSVMTVGNEAVTMDVAAFATEDGRTMVPVRFIAEAAGFNVEATYNADGSTASVVFTK